MREEQTKHHYKFGVTRVAVQIMYREVKLCRKVVGRTGYNLCMISEDV